MPLPSYPVVETASTGLQDAAALIARLIVSGVVGFGGGGAGFEPPPPVDVPGGGGAGFEPPPPVDVPGGGGAGLAQPVSKQVHTLDTEIHNYLH